MQNAEVIKTEMLLGVALFRNYHFKVCVRNAEVVEKYKDLSLYTPNSNQPKYTHICHQAKEPATKIALYIEYVLTYNSIHRRLFRAKDWIKIYPF